VLLTPGHQTFSRTCFCLKIVDAASLRATASAKNFSIAFFTVGISGFTTPMVPAASQPRTRSDAASQERRSSDRRMYSPRRVSCTQMGRADCSLSSL
jgi:hypothetical protein